MNAFNSIPGPATLFTGEQSTASWTVKPRAVISKFGKSQRALRLKPATKTDEKQFIFTVQGLATEYIQPYGR